MVTEMEDLTPEESKDSLKKILEICICQVCHEQLRSSNIAVCLNGHAICIGCKQRVTSCGMCHSAFSRGKPTALCQIIDILPRFCRYDYGCKHKLCENDDHESWCDFRLLTCIYCRQDIEVGKLLKHFFDVHKYIPHSMLHADHQRPNFKCEGLNINTVFMKIHNSHMFYIHYFYCNDSRSLITYVSFHPRKSDENTFVITFEIQSKEKDKLTFSRKLKLEPNVKTIAFQVPSIQLEMLNDKYVFFKTVVSDDVAT